MLERYVNLLQNGEVVAFPTETVYGLGASAVNAGAVRKVFEVKQRPTDNPLIVHIASREMLIEFAADIPPKANQLMQKFWPGPLTLIFKKKTQVLDIVTAGLQTVAVRWPNHSLAQALIAQTGPLVAPSANSSGRPSPTKPEHVKEDFGPSFPVVEAGETQIGLESTVLDVSQKPFKLYRPGDISRKEIEAVIGEKIKKSKSGKVEKPKSPGQKYSHYAPDAEVHWLEDDDLNNDKALYLLHSKSDGEGENVIHFNEDYTKMAHQLFDRFRSADRLGYKKVVVEPFNRIKAESPVAALQNRVSKAVGK